MSNATTGPLTDAEIAALEGLEAKATAGRWEVTSEGVVSPYGPPTRGMRGTDEDFALIVLMRNTLKRLLADRARLVREVGEARAIITDLRARTATPPVRA